jgi:hypothetical protein
MMRSGAVHIAGRLTYREQLEVFYRANPGATPTQAAAATDAPITVARFVRAKVRDALRVPPRRRDLWASL